MKIALVKVSAPSDFKDYKKKRGGPPQSIFSAAAATPSRYSVEMFDETVQAVNIDQLATADLIVLFFSTPDAMRGYELASQLRNRGRQVVLAGLHVTFMTQEAAEYADAVITGECENVWDEVLSDAERRQLKPLYQGTSADLDKVAPYPTHLISHAKYDGFWSVLVSRGCKHKCSFCLVPEMLGKTRYRPIENIVAEISRLETDWMELHADHLTENREYALELFKALEPLNINWVGETTIRIADDPELLEAAAKSGCRYLLVGIETPSKSALKYSGKGFVKADNVKAQIDRLHQHGIIVDSAAILGFDEHDTRIFKESADFFNDVGIDVCVPAIMIPFPGSRVFQQMDKEGRILTRDWSKYDGTHAVFEPKLMSSEELEKGSHDFYYRFNSPGKYTKRKFRQIKQFGAFSTMYI
ncbi:radical SAM protein [Endozoicomonas sp. OPT23]|uniref:B12-binding domain-containing radical SAM protein n=1 Tax=Endozoicomonas sp. OPT23 TaxID=2072845 RepID=UPI00129BF048|nr:radical SAM protein [Endozoicomonas sp. OPT23]MRI35459.1 radical SAM protein [Endozoicomonas sp. OPT23]